MSRRTPSATGESTASKAPRTAAVRVVAERTDMAARPAVERDAAIRAVSVQSVAT
ncbi:hypothetical protein [Olsenella uli]|uniref:hypothetical protein n=1 Tax=Olsenella uli TaxID=133926 RepID=UPI0012E354C7|nr:hypothetical protein [Olsenella uli]